MFMLDTDVLIFMIRALRSIVDAARARAESEVGLTADNWRSLDPRQFDPRRIVREALLEERRSPNAAEKLNRAKPPQKKLELGETPPVDLEAT
jgi:sec-independent protein translocase protein TatB